MFSLCYFIFLTSFFSSTIDLKQLKTRLLIKINNFYKENDLSKGSQLTFTCSELTLETLEKGVEYAQS